MKKIQRFFMLAFISSLIFTQLYSYSVFASTSLSGVEDTGEVSDENVDDPEAEGKKYALTANAFLKKYGWSISELNWIASKPNTASDYEIELFYFTEKELKTSFEKEMAASKIAGLTGHKYKQTGLVFAQATLTKTYNNEKVSYTFHLTFDSKKKNLLVSGYTTVKSKYGTLYAYEPLSTKASALEKKVKSALIKQKKENQPIPYSATAALDFPGGVRVFSKNMENSLKIVFTEAGWNKVAFTKFYYTESVAAWYAYEGINEFNPNEFPDYLSPEEHVLAIRAGKASKLLSNVGLISEDEIMTDDRTKSKAGLSDFIYTEKTFKSGSNLYFIDFCAAFQNYDGGGPTIYTKNDLDYAFLIVKPGKKNAAGKLDRFFYPIDTPAATILSDMNRYFAGKTVENSIH